MAARLMKSFGKGKKSKEEAAAPHGPTAEEQYANRHKQAFETSSSATNHKNAALPDPLPAAKQEPAAQDEGRSNVIHVTIVEARSLSDSDMQPFCVVEYDAQQARTKSTQKELAYKWDQSFTFDVTGQSAPLTVWVYAGVASPSPSSASASAGAPSASAGALGDEDICLGTLSLVPALKPQAALPPAHSPKLSGPPLSTYVDEWVPLRRVLPSDPMPTGAVRVRYAYEQRKLTHRLCMEDFAVLRVIGKGSFGKVMVVMKKDSGRIYALKVLNKAHLNERGEIQHTLSERKILQKIENPFLVSLKFSFQTPEKVYLVLDYVAGGELFVHLQKEGCFSEERSRFYAAMLILALECLHQHNIIYRDLKPENILFDMNGYIKLTDFGLCKENISKDDKTKTFCGTPEYMAPEILQQQGYGMEVDWWTVGTLLYEMLTGLPPFYDENTQSMYQKILFDQLKFTDECSPHARTLISGLLQRNPERRQGRANIEEIKGHPFFASINWSDLLAKRVKPPWKPSLTSALDTSNFDPEFTRMKAIDTPVAPSMLAQSIQDQFLNFTFAAPSELTQERS